MKMVKSLLLIADPGGGTGGGHGHGHIDGGTVLIEGAEFGISHEGNGGIISTETGV